MDFAESREHEVFEQFATDSSCAYHENLGLRDTCQQKLAPNTFTKVHDAADSQKKAGVTEGNMLGKDMGRDKTGEGSRGCRAMLARYIRIGCCMLSRDVRHAGSRIQTRPHM
jgi:hypothetical protein